MKAAIIGDIHGQHKEMLELLSKLPNDIEQIYTTGDLIDRGPDSKSVIQECIDRKIRCVMGNHEHMAIDFFLNKGEYDSGIFLMNGGDKTLESYGMEITDDGIDASLVPDSHIKFMSDLPYFIETDDFILSHAGITPLHGYTFRDSSSMSKQNAMWNREGRIADNLDKLQVFGHTPHKNIQLIKKEDEVRGINIDAGACYGYSLSAVILPSMDIVSVKC